MAYFECIVGGGGGGTSLIIQISTTSESLYGQTITISKNGSTVGTTTFNNQGEAEYTVDEAGTYTVSATVSGTTYSDTVEVTDTFEASIEAGFNYHTWLVEGDVSDTYSSLNEVLADEEAVRKLMTIHDAVDYLASFNDSDTSVVAILNNDYCAKWISLTDYAMDVLEAAYGTLMGTIGKYGYGEWAILDSTTTPVTWGAKGAVPIMTSNTAPYGEVFFSPSTIYSSDWNGYKAFDGNISTGWQSKNSGEYYLGYKFTNPVKVKTTKMYLVDGTTIGRFTTCVVQGSNDKSTWTNITEDVHTSLTVGWNEIPTTRNEGYFLYYRVYIGNTTAPYIHSLQFYGRELKVSVPTMTSNTSPYGEAIKSAEFSGSSYYAWNAFAPSVTKGWDSDSTNPYIHANNYVGYKFVSPVVIKKALFLFGYSNSAVTVSGKFQGHDGSDWVDLCDAFSFTSNISNIPAMVEFTKNIGNYQQYRWICTTQPNGGNHYGIHLNLYGVDYSERDWDTSHPRHYIYDHGVELETLTKDGYTRSGFTVVEPTREPNQLYFFATGSTSKQVTIGLDTALDMTSYSLERICVGDKMVIGDSSICGTLRVATTKDRAMNSNNSLAAMDMGSTISYPYQIGLDVSSINESVFANVQSGYGSRQLSVTEWWLE